MRRLTILPFLLAAASLHAQDNAEIGDNGGLAALRAARQKYAAATTLHVEHYATITSTSPNFKSTQTRELKYWQAPGGRMRLESANSAGSALVVADGQKEWILHKSFDEYVERPAGRFATERRSTRWDDAAEGEAYALRNPLSTLPDRITAAHLLADETININGGTVDCKVVRITTDDLITASDDATIEETIYLSKATGLLSRVTSHNVYKLHQGNIYPPKAGTRTIDTVEDYKVDEIGTVLPDDLFHFQPPPGARLVTAFTDVSLPASTSSVSEAPAERRGSNEVGSIPPPFTLTSASGEILKSESLRGKPVLIDFWATWCGPCRSTMPTLKKLHEKTATLGLAMIGIDQDDDTAKGPAFYKDKKMGWADYHRTGSSSRAFPHSAIPTQVLLDKDGRIVYFHTGSNEKGLIAAISSLGPEYSDVLAKF